MSKNGKFGQKFKLKKRKEISEILKSGTTWECNLFRVTFNVSCTQYSRFAVLVSKRLGNAAKRNKIKRYFREIFRCSERIGPPYFNILIQPKLAVSDKKFSEICLYYKQWQNIARLESGYFPS